jgi:HNH endonuclease
MKQYQATQYYELLVDEFYLDSQDQVRRTKDGYYKRFKADDLALFFVGTCGYEMFQLPRIRSTLRKSQLVYSLKYGRIPEGMDVDHIDGDILNNKPDNLRLVTRAVNNRNRKKRCDNTSGITGIRWSKYHQHYVIRRTVGDKRLSTSRNTIEEAQVVLDRFKALDTSYTDRHGM